METRSFRAATTPGRPGRRRRRWLSWLVIGVPAGLVGLLLLAVGARWWLDRFLRSEDFRRFLNRKTSAALQAEARLEPLRWEGAEVYTAGLDMRGTPRGPLTAFNADQVRAAFDLGALWRRVWRVETVDIERITADLGNDPVAKDAPDQPSPDKVGPPGSDRHPLAFLLPNRMEVGELRVADFTLGWRGGRLGNTRLKAQMLGDVHNWEIEGAGGKLSQADVPAVTLEEFAVRTTREKLFVTRASGRPQGGGKLELSGTQELVGDRALNLTVNLDGVPVGPFLPPDWRGRLQGKATARAQVTGSPADASSWRANGHFDLREGQLEALPVLDQLALFSSSVRYRHAVVQRGGADFVWTPNSLQVRNLVVESEGLLRVEGGFTVRARQIDGSFQVGVAVSSVRWVNELGASVFDLPQHDGYAWTTMRVTGPVDHPKEDLTGRLAASASENIIHKAQQGTGAVLDTAHSLLDLLKGR